MFCNFFFYSFELKVQLSKTEQIITNVADFEWKFKFLWMDLKFVFFSWDLYWNLMVYQLQSGEKVINILKFFFKKKGKLCNGDILTLRTLYILHWFHNTFAFSLIGILFLQHGKNEFKGWKIVCKLNGISLVEKLEQSES